MSQVEWRAVRQPSGTADTDLVDVRPVTDTVNRFARSATIVFEDPDGTKQSSYARGQRVELEWTTHGSEAGDADTSGALGGGLYGNMTYGGGTHGGEAWSRRFAGMVMETSRVSRDGAALEVELLSYDHLLRRREVFKSYSSTAKTSILNDLVTTFTPINWDAANVTVVNDDAIDMDFQGVRVDEAIQRVLSASADEQFGVNDDFEFFTSEQSSGVAPNDILAGDWFSYDLPERGKQTVNRVRVFYGDPNNRASVIVEDRAAQKNLQNDLNAPRNVVLEETRTFPEIGTEAQAKRKGEQILSEKSKVLTGTVTTYGRFNTEPGDVFRLEIPERSIDTDFRVAQIEYQWQRDETVVTVAENVGDVSDLLVNLSDEIKRISAREADASVTPTQFAQFRSGVTLSASVTVREKAINDDQFTFGLGSSASTLSLNPMDNLGFQFDNYSEISSEASIVTAAALNMLRDIWQGESATGITHFGFGGDDTVPGVSENSLQSALGRVGAMEFSGTDAAEAFQLDGYISAGNTDAMGETIAEFGFFDAASDGDMYLRTTAADTTHDGTTEHVVRVVVTIDTDSDLRGVITAKGQERLRDLFVGETGHEPDEMVYGTGTTGATESDTALGNRQHADTIDSTADRDTGVTDIVERTTSGEADTTNWSEVGYENSSNELLARIVFDDLDSDVVFEVNYQFQASNA